MFKKLLLLFFVVIAVPSYTIDPLVKKDFTKTIDLIYKDFESIFDESADTLLDILLTNTKAYALAKNLEKIFDTGHSLSEEKTDELDESFHNLLEKISKKTQNFEKSNKWKSLIKN